MAAGLSYFTAQCGRVRSRLHFIRLAPFDTTTEQGRADERHRRVALSGAASALAKVLSLGATLISVPLTLHYLGSERYGVWMTISSFIGILSFADLGLGNGVLNAIADANGRDDRAAIRNYISSAAFLLGLTAATILAAFALAYPFVHWYAIFNLRTAEAQAECGPACAAFMVCFALSIPAGIIQRVQSGMQEAFAASLWQCAASLCSVAAILLAIAVKASLPMLVAALMGAPLIATLANSILYFGWIRREIRPAVDAISRPAMRVVARTGFLFLVLQIVGAVAYSSDNLIIAQLIGITAVSSYAVADKLFSVVPMVIGMAFGALWPAYGEANARGDQDWIWRTLRISVIVTAAFATFAALAIVAGGPFILRLWVGHAIAVSFPLLLGMAVWKIVQTVWTTLAYFLNGMNVVGFQVIAGAAFAVASIALKIGLVKWSGVSGVPWASTLAYLATTGVPILIYVRHMRTLQAEPTVNAQPSAIASL